MHIIIFIHTYDCIYIDNVTHTHDTIWLWEIHFYKRRTVLSIHTHVICGFFSLLLVLVLLLLALLFNAWCAILEWIMHTWMQSNWNCVQCAALIMITECKQLESTLLKEVWVFLEISTFRMQFAPCHIEMETLIVPLSAANEERTSLAPF